MKTIFKTGIASILFLAVSCKKETIQSPSVTGTPSSDNAVTTSAAHYIGESYGGGIIFFIDSTTEHGLIAATEDLGRAKWFNSGYVVTGAVELAIGKGLQNTRKIIQAQGTSGNYAALMCARYKAGNYKDWFLPSRDELNELYKQKNVVGGFAADGYWSSTESARHFAWYQYFVDGYQYAFLKSNSIVVRAIRAF